MKKLLSLVALIVLTLQPLFAYGEDNSIYYRLQESMPLFNPTPCSIFMLPYGSSEKELKQEASRLGLIFVKKEQLDRIPGAYILAYVDPDNILTEDGDTVTTNILYIFTFHPRVGYFSYTIRLAFTDFQYAAQGLDALYRTLDENLEVHNFSNVNFAVVRCNNEDNYAYNNIRAFSCIPEKAMAAFTFTMMDMTLAETLSNLYNTPPKQYKRKK